MSDKYYNKNKYELGIPEQAISERSKTKAWKERNVDSIIAFAGSDLSQQRSKQRMSSNYNLVNSIYDPNDFGYVTAPYGMDGSTMDLNQPSKLRSYNLIVNKINLLKGEELSRPFNYSAIAVNGNAVTLKEKQAADMVKKVLQMEFAKALGEFGNPPEMQEGEPQSIQELEKWKNYSLQDIREVWANDLLKYLEYELDLHNEFQELWNHALISSVEIGYVGILNGEPNVRTCNPMYCDFDRNPSNNTIEDGDWFREDRFMTKGQIVDEYGEYLTDAEVRKLDKNDVTVQGSTENPIGFAHQLYKLQPTHTTNSTPENLYRVSTVTWKSLKKIGFLTGMEEEEESIMVDEGFKLTNEMKAEGFAIEWTWIPEVWQGTKVEDSIYVNIEPLAYQGRSMDNPRKVKLPYIGKVHNATNSLPTSVVDLLKPFQYMYMITWFNLEREMNKAQGKKFVLDMAQIPKSEGIDMNKWMYIFSNMDIAVINSLEESDEKKEKSNFNQFSSVDMSMSQSVGQFIGILTKIEQLIDKVVGITPQREGQTKASETASGTQAAIANSTYITEPWFYQHNIVKKNILTALLEVSKFAYKNKKKLNYIMNDISRVFQQIDMEKFPDSDYGVFITNSGKDREILDKLQRLADTALSSGMLEFSSIVDILKTNSIAEISHGIKDAEANKQQREQQQAQADRESAQQLQESAQQFEAEQNQLDRENKIQIEAIKASGFDTDTQDSGKVEAFDYAATALEQSKINSDNINKEKDRELKREEIKSKEKIEKAKNKTALKNKVSGEK